MPLSQGGRRGVPTPRGRGTDPPGPGYASQYAAASQKTQRGPEYKQYTLEDYRRLKKEVRLGGLGPELDSHELREKVCMPECVWYMCPPV